VPFAVSAGQLAVAALPALLAVLRAVLAVAAAGVEMALLLLALLTSLEECVWQNTLGSLLRQFLQASPCCVSAGQSRSAVAACLAVPAVAAAATADAELLVLRVSECK
jgi:hypothetical protein